MSGFTDEPNGSSSKPQPPLRAFSKIDLDGHDLPPSPAPSSPRNGRKYAFATELVFTEGNDQYNASSTPIYQVCCPCGMRCDLWAFVVHEPKLSVQSLMLMMVCRAQPLNRNRASQLGSTITQDLETLPGRTLKDTLQKSCPQKELLL